jgi:aspartate racemase
MLNTLMRKEKGNKVSIAIIGGTGPEATILLQEKIFKITRDLIKPTLDQNHIPVITFNDPRIPDRSSKLTSDKIHLIKYYRDRISSIFSMKIDTVMIACNTAHLYFKEIVEGFENQGKIFNFIDEATKCYNTYETKTKIAVFSTIKTYKSGLYDKAFTNSQHSIIEMPNDVLISVQKAIYGIKAGFTDKKYISENQNLLSKVYQQIDPNLDNNTLLSPHELLTEAIKKIKTLGVETVILGCTELGIVLSSKNYNGLKIYDASDLFAERVVNYCLMNN